MTPASTPRDELLLGWAAQAQCYPELTFEQKLDAAHDLPSTLESLAQVEPQVPQFRSIRQ